MAFAFASASFFFIASSSAFVIFGAVTSLVVTIGFVAATGLLFVIIGFVASTGFGGVLFGFSEAIGMEFNEEK